MSRDGLGALDGLDARTTVVLVAPSGVGAFPTDGGYVVARTFTPGCVAHLDAPGDGLLAELRSGREPVPYRSAADRDGTLAHLRDDRPDLDAETRDALLRHVAATPHYEAEEGDDGGDGR